MGIRVRCSNGHDLKVKDSYAGKQGRCPYCKAIVQVPEKVSDDEILKLLMAGGLPKRALYPPSDDHDHDHEGASIHDEPHAADRHVDSLSLLGLSAVRHTKQCHDCGQRDPHWYATCSRCGAAFPGHECR